MTRDFVELHRQTNRAIDLVYEHRFEKCIVECSKNGLDWWPVDATDFSSPFYRARIKPTKKIVPWSSLDEVPLMHWFRFKGVDGLLRVEGVNPSNTALPIRIGKGILSFRELLDLYEHAIPCDKHSDLIWLPCGKEVVE